MVNIQWDTVINVSVIIASRILVLVLVLFVLNKFLNFIAKRTVQKISNKQQAKQIYTILATLKSIADLVVVSIFALEVLPKLGIDIRPILTAAGVLGVAVGFGSKQLVEDVLSGINLILQGQLLVGDIVEIDGREGIVEKLNLKTVILRDWDGKVHYIRNGMINVVTNHTRDFAFAIVEIGVAYKESVDNVIKVVQDVVEQELKTGPCAEYIIGDLEVWGLDSFGDSSVNLKFRIKTKISFQWKVKREINRLVKNKFDELGIEIPFPQRTLHIEKSSLERLV